MNQGDTDEMFYKNNTWTAIYQLQKKIADYLSASAVHHKFPTVMHSFTYGSLLFS